MTNLLHSVFHTLSQVLTPLLLVAAGMQMPPKGVEWEVSYGPLGDTKPIIILVDKDYDNVYLKKLVPGEPYVGSTSSMDL